MEDKLKHLLKNKRLADPSADLLYKIIDKINFEKELNSIKKSFFLSVFLFLSSTLILIVGLDLLINKIKNSGFIYFLQTLFLDYKTIFNFWGDYLMAFLEFLPLFEIILIILGIIILFFDLEIFLSKKKSFFKFLKHSI
ncbi:MAG: hypothetical protein ACPL3E_01605 [Minisyncoccia bacterium]